MYIPNMMKTHCLFISFIFGAVFLCATVPYSHLEDYNKTSRNFFQKFISGNTATYMICVDKKIKNENLNDTTVNNLFLSAFNDWITKTEQFISENDRNEEFNDILEMLNNGIIKQIPCSIKNGNVNNDKSLAITFTNQTPCYTGCYKNNTIYINMEHTKSEDYFKILKHELGHAWGLADQYPGQIYRGSFLYNSKKQRSSIMWQDKEITCDDGDGFITSIDRTLGNSREFYSLCSDDILIKNGQGSNKDITSFTFSEAYDLFDANITISYNENDPDSYGISMILYDFILSEAEGLELMNGMGFNVPDIDTLYNVVIKINGTLQETQNEPRKAVGIWTSTLYIKKDSETIPTDDLNLDAKQRIIKNYSQNSPGEFIGLDTNISYEKDCKIPIADFFLDAQQREIRYYLKERYNLRKKLFDALRTIEMEKELNQ